MNVVMFGEIPPINNGGVGIHIENLTNVLSQHNINIVIFSIGPQKGCEIKNGKKICYVKIYYPYRYTIYQKSFQKLLMMNKVIKRYDILHIHSLFFPFYYLINKNIPLVITMHGYISEETVTQGRIREESLQYRHMRKIEYAVAKRANAIIVVGKSARKWIIEKYNINPAKVFYIPNGIDPTLFKPIPKEKNPLGNEIHGWPILLFTKHFSPQYGSKDLIFAFKKIVKNYPDAKLIMVGDDKYKKNIEEFVAKLKLTKHVMFPGKFKNNFLPYFYSISDIFINPTATTETFGITIIEAMACETPVIATNVGGPKEIIEEGFRQMGKPVGILVPPKNPEALAEAIESIIEHKKDARDMGKSAREYVLKNYTWDIVARKTLKVYNHVIKNPKNLNE